MSHCDLLWILPESPEYILARHPSHKIDSQTPELLPVANTNQETQHQIDSCHAHLSVPVDLRRAKELSLGASWGTA